MYVHNSKHTQLMHACTIKKEGRLVHVNEKFFKFKNEDYKDSINSIGDMIGMVYDADIRVNRCIMLLL